MGRVRDGEIRSKGACDHVEYSYDGVYAILNQVTTNELWFCRFYSTLKEKQVVIMLTA